MKQKADLQLLKQLVKTVEEQLEVSYAIRDKFSSENSDALFRDFVIELSKAVGILYSVSQESSLLITDLQKIMTMSDPKASSVKESFMDLLSPKNSGIKN